MSSHSVRRGRPLPSCSPGHPPEGPPREANSPKGLSHGRTRPRSGCRRLRKMRRRTKYRPGSFDNSSLFRFLQTLAEWKQPLGRSLQAQSPSQSCPQPRHGEERAPPRGNNYRLTPSCKGKSCLENSSHRGPPRQGTLHQTPSKLRIGRRRPSEQGSGLGSSFHFPRDRTDRRRHRERIGPARPLGSGSSR